MMTNMKCDKNNAPAVLSGVPEAEGPEYPWGLEINLDTESLKKLGIALPAVGTEFAIIAKGRVTGTSNDESEGSEEPRQSVRIQLTDMEMNKRAEQDPMARAIYGKGHA
jgi:hypothetical protein